MSAEDRPHADLPRVIAGSPTEEELAAVAAVFAQLIAERAGARRIREAPTTSRRVQHWPTSLRQPAWDGNYWAARARGESA